jgi:hypothetical protein
LELQQLLLLALSAEDRAETEVARLTDLAAALSSSSLLCDCIVPRCMRTKADLGRALNFDFFNLLPVFVGGADAREAEK